METTCQASYPLNSENASPPGTFREYLSCWADTALLLKALTSAVTTAIVRMRLLFVTGSSLDVLTAWRSSRQDSFFIRTTVEAPGLGRVPKTGSPRLSPWGYADARPAGR